MSKDVYMLTFHCTNMDCLAVFRIGRIIKAPVIKAGAFQFCAMCGHRGLAMGNAEDSFWDSLSEAYDIPVEGLQLIMTIWNSQEDPNFAEFAKKTWYNVKTKAG